MPRVGIVGAGIAGLTAAYYGLKRGLEVHVIEATARSGGTIQSSWTDGFLVEHGPNLLRPRPPVITDVIEDLGLSNEIVTPDPGAADRFIVRNGQLVPLPQSLWALLTTRLFSIRGKLRLLAEPFVSASSAKDESVASFARRRLGNESLDYAVNPVVGGTFAGDPEQLSMRHVFGTLYQREREYGSLLRGAFHANGAAKNGTNSSNHPSRPFSFQNGLDTLSTALTKRLDGCIEYRAPVTAITPTGSGCRLCVDAEPAPRTDQFDAVICTAPLHRFGAIDLDTPVDCSSLERVPYPPVSVLNLGFRREDVDHSLSGLGFLVPEAETQFSILGAIFSSSLFPRRAPDGQVLLTTFVGGTRNRTLGTTATAKLLPLVTRDLDALLGLGGAPTFVHHVRLPYALPQYTLDHDHVQSTLDAVEAKHDSLFFAGNYRDGISVGAAMDSGVQALRNAVESHSESLRI